MEARLIPKNPTKLFFQNSEPKPMESSEEQQQQNQPSADPSSSSISGSYSHFSLQLFDPSSMRGWPMSNAAHPPPPNAQQSFVGTSGGFPTETWSGAATKKPDSGQQVLESSMMMEQEDWPSSSSSVALIGKDDFLGYPSSSSHIHCFSPPQSQSPRPTQRPPSSSMLEVVYEASISPRTKDSFEHPRHSAPSADHYGSDGISPSPSSYVSSSCSSSLSQSDDHNSSNNRSHSFTSSHHSLSKPSLHANGGTYAPLSQQSYSYSSDHVRDLRGADIIMGALEQTFPNSPNYALTISPSSAFENQKNGSLNLYPSPGSDYSVTQTPYNFVSSYASPPHMTIMNYSSQQPEQRGRCLAEKQSNAQLTPVAEESSCEYSKKMIIKGEITDDFDHHSQHSSSVEVLDFERRMQKYDEYASAYPDGDFYHKTNLLGGQEDEIASMTESTMDYSFGEDKHFAFTTQMDERHNSSSSSSPSTDSTLKRELILHEKMMPLPPAKTRSKMHDLAVRHQLITNQNPRSHGMIQLSAEEKRTLLQEGYSLPTRLPLTREEEEALKIARRKIKNKLSAQESRRKRKEYMDSLEKKVHVYFGDNVSLRNRVKQLEAMNRDLMSQVKKLQSSLQASHASTTTTTNYCQEEERQK